MNRHDEEDGDGPYQVVSENARLRHALSSLWKAVWTVERPPFREDEEGGRKMGAAC